MTNAFEFLEPCERRIGMPRFSVIFFMLVLLGALSGLLGVRSYSNSLQQKLAVESSQIEQLSAGIIEQARSKMFSPSLILELSDLTARHNHAMGGSRTAWTSFFNAIESVVPRESVILAVENSVTGRPSFSTEDRSFRVSVAVSDSDAAEQLYLRLSESSAFESLGFTPKGDILHQGRRGTVVELSFHFNQNHE